MRLWLLLLLVAAFQFATSYPVEEESTELQQNSGGPAGRFLGLGKKKTPEEKRREKEEKERKKIDKAAKEAAKKEAERKKKLEKEERKKKEKELQKQKDAAKAAEKAARKEQQKKDDAAKKADQKKQDELDKMKKEEKKKQKEEKKRLEKEAKDKKNKEKKEKEKLENEAKDKKKKEEKEKKRLEKEAKDKKKKEEKEKKKKEEELKKQNDPKYAEKKKKEDAVKFSSLNKKNETIAESKTKSKSKVSKLTDFLTKKYNTTADKLKPMISELKNKTKSKLDKIEFKTGCVCEDKVCECCAKFMLKVCFTTVYQRVQEKSIVTLKIAARVGIEIPLYTEVLHFNKKAPACTDVGSPIGRVCIKAEKTEVKKNKGSGFDATIDIKVLFDNFLTGVEMKVEFENGTLESKSIELIDHVPKAVDETMAKSSEESKESAESKEEKKKDKEPAGDRLKVRLKVDPKYQIKLKDVKKPKKWIGLQNPIAMGLRKAKDGKCECEDEECECCVVLGTFKACVNAVYTPPTEGITDDSYLDKESGEGSGENNSDGDSSDSSKGSGESNKSSDEQEDEDDDDDDNDGDDNLGGVGAMITLIGSFKRVAGDKTLASVSYQAIGNTEDDVECEPKSRFGNLCLKIDTVYLEDEDETKGVCFAFVMNEYGFGFKKCIALEDDGTLTIGDPE